MVQQNPFSNNEIPNQANRIPDKKITELAQEKERLAKKFSDLRRKIDATLEEIDELERQLREKFPHNEPWNPRTMSYEERTLREIVNQKNSLGQGLLDRMKTVGEEADENKKLLDELQKSLK